MNRDKQIEGIEWIAALRALARRMQHAGHRAWGDDVDRLATALRDGQEHVLRGSSAIDQSIKVTHEMLYTIGETEGEDLLVEEPIDFDALGSASDTVAQPAEQEERLTKVEWWEWFGEQVGRQKAQEIEDYDVSLVDEETWAAVERLKREGASPAPGTPVEVRDTQPIKVTDGPDHLSQQGLRSLLRFVEVTDEMVDRAYRAFLGSDTAYVPNHVGLRNMRAALHAALEEQ